MSDIKAAVLTADAIKDEADSDNGSTSTAEGDEELIKKLAAMTPLEYAKARAEAAKQLGVAVRFLDSAVKAARGDSGEKDSLGLFEPDPWPEEVDGDDLLDRIAAALLRFMVMTPEAADVVALWIVHAHCFDLFQKTPRLNVAAPEKGCGKSTLLDVVACLVPRGVKAENISTAAMFRAVDQWRPTLLIDEVDTFLRDNEELRGALNSGHSKGGKVLRCEGDDNAIKAFNTFAPAALAGIGSIPPTLADRSIAITLQKRKPGETIADFRDDRAGFLRELASQAVRWADDSRAALAGAEPTMPAGVHNRTADNWRPLFAIADVAGGSWPERSREAAALILSKTTDDSESRAVQLLGDIRLIFERDRLAKISSQLLAERLLDFEDRPWAEYGRKGSPISKAQVARLLKPFAISPGTIRLEGGSFPKGYYREAFEEAWERYLPPTPPCQNATPPQPAEFCGKPDIPKRHTQNDVAFTKTPQPTGAVACGGVAFWQGGNGTARVSEPLSNGHDDACCLQCGNPIEPEQETIPVAGRGEIHSFCYDAFFEENLAGQAGAPLPGGAA